MSNSPLPPLDPAVKEYLNQLGDMMMNRFNDRVNQLIEHLTPIPQGNNTGMINGGNQGEVEERNKSSSASPSTARAIKEKHVEHTHDQSPEDEGAIGRIVLTEAVRKEAKAWFKKV